MKANRKKHDTLDPDEPEPGEPIHRLRKQFPTILATSAFWILLFGAYLLFNARRLPAQPIEIIPPPTTLPTVPAQSFDTPTPAPLRVYVSGAVRQPGVYRLPPDSLVEDAIAQAGGASEDADLVAINLAHALADGEQIYVPRQEENAPPPPAISSQTSTLDTSSQAANVPVPPSDLVDLNTASAEALESLPGVGPKTAQAIMNGRPYGSVEDLLRVKGIGEKTLAKLRPYITVR